MAERIPQSTTIRVPLQAYLASDHVSPATGKTIAITISKNGAAYANPSAGATNATEIASGSYYVDLSTTDTATLGPLFVKGAEAATDTIIAIYNVVKATNGGLTALPDTAATTNASLLTSGTGTDQISVSAGKLLLQATQTGVTIPTVTTVTNQLTAAQIATGVWQDATAGDFTTASSIGKALYIANVAPGAAGGHFIAGTNAATTITTGLTTTFTGNLTGSVASVTGAVGSVTGAVGSVTGAVGSVTGLTASNLDATVSSRMATYTQPTGFLAATFPTGTVANTTNITAGTITTATNLTNAPTAGDFTATMKTSLNAATPAVTVSDKTGFSLTSAYDLAKTAAQAGDAMALTSGERNSTADALLDRSAGIETGFTPRQGFRLWSAILLGKLSGAGSGTEIFRSAGDVKDRVTATVDSSGNRTAITLDAT